MLMRFGRDVRVLSADRKFDKMFVSVLTVIPDPYRLLSC